MTDRDTTIPSNVIDIAALVLIVVLVVVISLGPSGPIRGVLALGFLTFVPGWAVVTHWASGARLSRIALSVLLSLSICTACATISLWLHVWQPLVLFYVLAIASSIAIVARLVRHRAVPEPPSVDP